MSDAGSEDDQEFKDEEEHVEEGEEAEHTEQVCVTLPVSNNLY